MKTYYSLSFEKKTKNGAPTCGDTAFIYPSEHSISWAGEAGQWLNSA